MFRLTSVSSRTWSWVLVVGMLSLLLVARLYDLEADPPPFFADNSQGLSTDAGHLTWHAKNKILYGTWDAFGYTYWVPFKISVVTGLTYLTYSLLDVSRLAGNVTGVILNLLGTVVFLFALKRHVPRGTLLLTMFLISTSFVLAVYGRLPFAENGMLLFASLGFLMYSYWFDSPGGKALVGVLIGLCAILGKTFGILVLAAPLLAVLVYESGRRWRSVGVLVLSACLPAVLFELFLAGNSGALELIMTHSARGGAAPGGLVSPLGFLEHLIGFSARAQLLVYTPIAALLTYVLLVQLVRGQWRSLLRNRGVVFLLGWCLATIVFLSPFNYVPLRYLMPLVLPLSALAAIAISRLLSPETEEKPARLSAWRALLLTVLNWMLVYYVMIRVFTHPGKMVEYYDQVWWALPGGLLLTAVFWLVQRRSLPILPKRVAVVAGALALSAAGTLFVVDSGDWMATRTYTIRETNSDLGAILGERAVVSGQYGPALVADQPIRSIPYYTDDAASVQEDLASLAELCRAYPVTHLVVTKPYWADLTGAVPELGKAPIVSRYWVRNKTVIVVRVSELFGNARAAVYEPTRYERAFEAFGAGRADDAWALLEEFNKENPRSKAGILGQYYVSMAQSGLKAAEPYILKLLRYYPTDFTVQAAAAMYYRHLAIETHDPSLRERAQEHLQAAINYNPAGEKPLRDLYERFSPAVQVL
ncbi:hypothetical protein GF377_02915 [candidate division GN15 bacterium]|nr:hypothetical protein [candidate division GN15 bacterium]